jgi:hypothetical protein
MKTSARQLLLSSILIFSGVSGLHAAVYTYNATVDLNASQVSSGLESPAGWLLPPAPGIDLGVGDTLQGTISFAGNVALQFSGALGSGGTSIFLDFLSPNTTTYTTTTTTLNGVKGPLSSPNPATSTPNGSSEVVAAVAPILTTTPRGTVSISGISYSALVTSGGGEAYPDELGVSYSPFGITVSVVPESSGYATGAAALGLMVAFSLSAMPRSSGGGRPVKT